MPLRIIDGKVFENEKICINDIEIGKILINGEYPFALIKFLDKNFNVAHTFTSKNGSFKIFIPNWLQNKI